MAVQIWPLTLEQRLMDESLTSCALTSAGKLMICTRQNDAVSCLHLSLVP